MYELEETSVELVQLVCIEIPEKDSDSLITIMRFKDDSSVRQFVDYAQGETQLRLPPFFQMLLNWPIERCA